ncbi:excalibur calcium-binding domain-containing protein [Streptomyces cupreus]|uniref:excalibur calcium-binding domain-containing protein n=1 Tax=Streptomyces cupreus TaxID=2759956 RepID=UPI003AB9995C
MGRSRAPAKTPPTTRTATRHDPQASHPSMRVNLATPHLDRDGDGVACEPYPP